MQRTNPLDNKGNRDLWHQQVTRHSETGVTAPRLACSQTVRVQEARVSCVRGLRSTQLQLLFCYFAQTKLFYGSTHLTLEKLVCLGECGMCSWKELWSQLRGCRVVLDGPTGSFPQHLPLRAWENHANCFKGKARPERDTLVLDSGNKYIFSLTPLIKKPRKTGTAAFPQHEERKWTYREQ